MKTSLKKRLDNGEITIEEYEILKKSNVEELLLIKKLEEEKLNNNFQKKINSNNTFDWVGYMSNQNQKTIEILEEYSLREKEKLRNNFKNKLNEIKPYDGISQDILKRVKSTTQLKSQHKKTKPSLKYQQKNNLEKGKIGTRIKEISFVLFFIIIFLLWVCVSTYVLYR